MKSSDDSFVSQDPRSLALDIQALLGTELVSVVRFDTLAGLAGDKPGDGLLVIVSDAGAPRNFTLLEDFSRRLSPSHRAPSIEGYTFSDFRRGIAIGDPIVTRICVAGEILLDPAGVFERLRASCTSGALGRSNRQVIQMLEARSGEHLSACTASLRLGLTQLYASLVLCAICVDVASLDEPVTAEDLSRLEWDSVRGTLAAQGFSAQELEPLEELRMLVAKGGDSNEYQGSDADLLRLVRYADTVRHKLLSRLPKMASS
jgi:hypothetical protein